MYRERMIGRVRKNLSMFVRYWGDGAITHGGGGLFIDFPPQHVMRLWRSCPPNAIKQRVSVRHVDGALMRSTGHPDIAPFPFQFCRSDGGLG